MIRNKESYIGKLNAKVIICKSVFRVSVTWGLVCQHILGIEFYTNNNILLTKSKAIPLQA